MFWNFYKSFYTNPTTILVQSFAFKYFLTLSVLLIVHPLILLRIGNVIDVVVAGTDNSVYICKDYTKFGTFEGGTNPPSKQLIAAGYELQDFKESTITGQYVKKLVNNNQADLFPTVVGNGASATTYYCNYHWTSTTATPRTLLIGGLSGSGSLAGLFVLLSNAGLGSSSAFVGTRITFYGEPALPAAPATLELDDEDYEQIDSMESEENWF